SYATAPSPNERIGRAAELAVARKAGEFPPDGRRIDANGQPAVMARNEIVLPSSAEAAANTPPAESQNLWGNYDSSTTYRGINNKDQLSANGALGGVSGQQESKVRELGRENFGVNLGAGSVDQLKESAGAGPRNLGEE